MELLLFNVFKINFIYTLEFLTLLFAIWFLAYSYQQQLAKVYRYVGGFIVLVMGAIIICTTVNLFSYYCQHQEKSGKCFKKRSGHQPRMHHMGKQACPHHHNFNKKKRKHSPPTRKEKHRHSQIKQKQHTIDSLKKQLKRQKNSGE